MEQIETYLRELALIPGLSGHEQRVAAYMERHFRAKAVLFDHRTGLLAGRRERPLGVIHDQLLAEDVDELTRCLLYTSRCV